jgi:hypothetical protein
MKNFLFGLIFLISKLALGVETETASASMDETDEFTYENSATLFSFFQAYSPEDRMNSDFLYFNSQYIFAIIHWPSEQDKEDTNDKKGLADIWVLDDDGFATLAYMVIALKQENNSPKRPLLGRVVINALERLKKCTTKPEFAKEIDQLANIIHGTEEKKLDALEKFISAHSSRFFYNVQNAKLGKLGTRRFDDFRLAPIKANLPPTSIFCIKPLSDEICSQKKSPVLKKEIIIEKKSLKVIVDKDIQALAEKFYFSDGKEEFTPGLPQYDSVAIAFQSIGQAFGVFEKIFRMTKKSTSQIRGCTLLLSAERLKEMRSGIIVNNLWQFSGKMDSGDRDEISKFLLPKPDGATPLYIACALSWSDGANNRCWIFEVKPIPSLDDRQIRVEVTMHERLGDEPDFYIIGELMNSTTDAASCGENKPQHGFISRVNFIEQVDSL